MVAHFHSGLTAAPFRYHSPSLTRHEPPPPAWCGTMGEARMWAEAAHELYRKAVALAAFEAMRPDNKTAFIEHVTARRAAA